MPTIKIHGEVKDVQRFDAKPGKEPNVAVNVYDVEKFGVSVPLSHPLASSRPGDVVDIEGEFVVRRKDGYVNFHVLKVSYFRRGVVVFEE